MLRMSSIYSKLVKRTLTLLLSNIFFQVMIVAKLNLKKKKNNWVFFSQDAGWADTKKKSP
jgi:hypothetical protein